MAETIRLGANSSLHMEIRFLPLDKSRPERLGWAEFQLAVQETPVWYAQDANDPEPGPVTWTMVDFLDGLARIWPWLLVEESYPIPIMPEHPGRMMAEAQRRWEDQAQHLVESEEELLFDFRHRHDLSLLFRGLFLPPLWLLREGNDTLVWSPDLGRGVRLPMDCICQLFTRLGDVICDELATSQEARAVQAVDRWHRRCQALNKSYLQLVTGLDGEELEQLTGSADRERQTEYFELEKQLEPVPQANELLLAARMSANYLPPTEQRRLLGEIKLIPSVATPQLDNCAERAPAPSSQSEAHEQGYQLALWLREALDLKHEEPAFPEQLLQQWGVPVKDIEIDAGLDAVAVWGVRHGPAVLINTSESSRASTQNGRRTTLAHEICHLLIDRSRSLPAAEVLGGQAPRFAEKRANAFAAEWLLPRSQAAQACRAANDIIEAANRLETQFLISREVVYHQINNSDIGASLTHPERKRLETWKMEILAWARAGG